MIAFVSDASGSPQIWIKNLAGGDPIRITSGDLNPSRPSWSPKNDQILFEGNGPNPTSPRGIWSVPPLGGSPRKLIGAGLCPCFSGDGSRIVFHRFIYGIFICAADGSDERLVETRRRDAYISSRAVLSPDGQRLAAFVSPQSGWPDLCVTPVDGAKVNVLLSERAEGADPVWTPDGRTIIFSSDRGGTRNLWQIPADGGSPEPLTTGAGDDNEPAVSGDGARLVYASVRNTHALMVLDTATGTSRTVLEQRELIRAAEFSPSGDQLVAVSSTWDKDQPFIVSADGTGRRPVPGEDGFLQWSADGASLYTFRIRPDVSIHRVSLAGGQPAEMGPAWKDGIATPPWVSPDGKRVAYSTQEEGKIVGTRVRDLETRRGEAPGDPRVATLVARRPVAGWQLTVRFPDTRLPSRRSGLQECGTFRIGAVLGTGRRQHLLLHPRTIGP